MLKKFFTTYLLMCAVAFSYATDSTSLVAELTEEVVISANKFAEKKRYIAQKIDILPVLTMKNSLSNTTASLLEESGKVFIQKSQLGGGSAVIRGFEASRILLVVDGLRMNNAIYRTGHLQNIITVDDDILERVEVLYGPSSTLYGSDALGGVVHLITKDPKFSNTRKDLVYSNASVRYGSASNEWTGHADVNIGSRKIASLTSITYSSFGDLRQGNVRNPFYGDLWKRKQYVEQIDGKDSVVNNNDPNLQKFSGYQQYDVLQKLIWQPKTSQSHAFNFQYSTSSDIPRYDRLTDERNGKLRWAEWYYGPQERLMAMYKYRTQGLGIFFDQMQAAFSYQKIMESRMQRLLKSADRSSRIENLDVFAGSVDLRKSYGRSELNIGLDGQINVLKSLAYKQNIYSNKKSYDLDSRYPDGRNNMNHVGIYMQHLYKIIPNKLILSDGLRLNYSTLHSTFMDTSILHLPFTEASQENFSYSGNVGMVYLPNEKSKVSLMLSTGFRIANIDDLAKVFESAGGEQIVVPNPNLKPEQTINFDVGSSSFLFEWLSIDMNVFYTLFRNAIVLDRFNLNGKEVIEYNGLMTPVVANQNKAKADIYGLQGSLNLYPMPSLSLYSHLSLTYGQYLDAYNEKLPMDHIPPLFGKTGINVNRKSTTFDLFARYNGWKHLKDYNPFGEDNLKYATPFGMPAWFTLNCSANWEVNKNFSIQMALENMFDQNYRVFASGISGAGRNFIVKLRASF